MKKTLFLRIRREKKKEGKTRLYLNSFGFPTTTKKKKISFFILCPPLVNDDHSRNEQSKLGEQLVDKKAKTTIDLFKMLSKKNS